MRKSAAAALFTVSLMTSPSSATAEDGTRALVSTNSPGQVAVPRDDLAMTLAAPVDTPITGAAIAPGTAASDAPPSLEALMATRPGYAPNAKVSAARESALKESALSYGARGGLAARNFAINEMLRRYETRLDQVYDFRSLVLPVGTGTTLLRPPIITEAQMAVALGDGGQTARETGTVWTITRHATLTYAAPNWRTYLVRSVAQPSPPPDDMRPRTSDEVPVWQQHLAEGWAMGERQANEIFLNDLGRLQQDIVGMARYRVLLRAGVVESPSIAFSDHAVTGGHDMMRVDDRDIAIKSQPGLNPNRAQWSQPAAASDGPLKLAP